MKQAFKNGVGFTLGIFVGRIIISTTSKLILFTMDIKKNNPEPCERTDATDEPTKKTE